MENNRENIYILVSYLDDRKLRLVIVLKIIIVILKYQFKLDLGSILSDTEFKVMYRLKHFINYTWWKLNSD